MQFCHLQRGARLFGLVFALVSFSLTAAQACTRSGIPAGAAQIVPTRGADQKLFNSVVLAEVNYYRCKAGLRPLSLSGGLIRVAGTHASWMAASQTLSHRSTIRGMSSVKERVLASGLKVHRGSENIGYLPRYQFGLSRKIRVRNMARCEFTTTAGRRITPHTYASLAHEIVGLWMKSAGHRRNLLDPNVKSVGAALGYDPQGTQCGQFFMAQNFAG